MPRKIAIERDAVLILPESQTAALLTVPERDLEISKRAIVVGYPDGASADEIDDIIAAVARLHGEEPEEVEG